MADWCTKFEVSSVSRCGDITWGVKFLNGSPDLDHAPFGKIFRRQGGTCHGKSVYQIWSLWVHPLQSYECQCKMGWFVVVRGHSRSWAMPPSDRAHMTFYLTLMETMCLSCTIFEIEPVICQRLPILTHPTCIWCPCRGWPRSNFAKIFGTRKLDSLDYCVVLFMWSCV